MGISSLRDLAGEWELAVDLPGAADVRGHVLFELMGDVLVQRTTVPVPEAPDSCCLVVTADDGSYVQHYFDSRGIARRAVLVSPTGVAANASRSWRSAARSSALLKTSTPIRCP